MSENDSSRQVAGDAPEISEVAALMQQLLAVGEKEPPPLMLRALVGTLLAYAAVLPEERARIVAELERNAALVRGLGMVDPIEAGKIFGGNPEHQALLNALQPPADGKGH